MRKVRKKLEEDGDPKQVSIWKGSCDLWSMWLQVEYGYSEEVTTRFDNMDIMGGLIRVSSTVESKEHKLY